MKIPIFFKRRRNYIWIAIALVIILGGYFLFRGKSFSLKTATAQIGNVERVISATGQISANDRVELSFIVSGKVSGVYSAVGGKTYKGQIIARLETSDLQAQLQGAEASVLAAQAKYDQLLSGARAEDLNTLQIGLKNAQSVLTDAKTKNSLTVAKTALNTATNSLVTVSDLYKKYMSLIGSYQTQRIIDGKESALFAIYNQRYLAQTEPWYFLSLQTGLPQEIYQYENGSAVLDGPTLLAKIKSILFTVQNILEATYSGLNITQSTDADKTSVLSANTAGLGQITAITNQEQAIQNAQNNVASLQSQLDLRKAPPTQFDIDISLSQLTQSKAGLAQIQAQIEKNILRSPINGIVANLDLRVGEIASPGKIAASIIGQNKFQIEAKIPEVDVAKIKTGDPVSVTLDAYGQDVVWDAVVAQIYPSENVIEGVPTYKTIIALNKEDSRIKSGMTANLDIKNDIRSNVLFLPQRAIIRKDGKKIVKISLPEDYLNDSRFANSAIIVENNKSKSTEVEIQTGLYGSDGRVEILGGLKEGDKIIIE